MALHFSLFTVGVKHRILNPCYFAPSFVNGFATAVHPSKGTLAEVRVEAAPAPPKPKPSSSFALFIQENFDELSSINPAETKILKLAGERWRALDRRQKNLYTEKANSNRDDNKRALQEYETKYSALERAKYMLDVSKANYEKLERAYKHKLRKAYPKPSGYNLFQQEFSKSFISDLSGIDQLVAFSSEVAQAWKKLNTHEKEMFKHRASEIRRHGLNI